MQSSRSRADAATLLDPGPMGFAHRGLHGPDVPENSLAAFRAALTVGAGIECDLRISADGTPMVFHDRDTRRLCGVSHVVSKSHAAQLGSLRLADTDEPIPTLVELLDLVSGRVPVLLELKDERNASRFAAAVVAALSAYPGPAGVMSFAAGVGEWLRQHASGLPRGLVISDRDGLLRRLTRMRRARPDFLAVKHDQLDRPWVHAARRDIPVYSWTIRSPADRYVASPLADELIWEADGRP